MERNRKSSWRETSSSMKRRVKKWRGNRKSSWRDK